MKKLYTIKEAAEYLRYSVSHTRRLIRTGKLPVLGKADGRNGGYRISEENIEEYIKSTMA